MSTRLGQNFLKDSKIISFITSKISTLIEKYDCDTLIEIWPGKGAITKRIAWLAPNFYVIETDNRMIPHIKLLSEKMSTKINIIHKDVLEVDLDQLMINNNINPAKTIVVWNLPYYITSPIVRKFFWWAESKYAGWFFMMQKEVWGKIKADASKKSFLRWMSNYAHHVKYSKTVPAKAFNPAPNVQSCLVTFEPKETPELSASRFNDLYNLLDKISPYKRKTLWKIRKMTEKNKSQSSTIEYALPEDLKSKRIEELSWDDMRSILQSN